MAEKQITNNELAKMIKNSFDNMEERFGQVEQKMATKGDIKSLDTRLSTIERDAKYIKENLTGALILEKDVEYIKNTLGIPAIKK